MLHIVQLVLSGSAEAPQVFLDESRAHAAYVACARKYWATSYAMYCERHGMDGDSFSSAQAFVASFDLADRSRIHYWNITPEGAGADVSQLLPGVAALVERRDQIQRLVQEVEQASGIVREGLTELLGFVAGVTGEESCAPVRPSASEDRDTPGRFTPAELPAEEPAAKAAEATTQHDDEYYKSKEWKSYVESIMNMCGGQRSEYHLFNRYDWRQAVYSNETSFEYWDWVAATIDKYIEMAQKAGYAVVDDPEKPGHYRFRTQDGVVSEVSSEAEGEAWCRAGLHMEGR